MKADPNSSDEPDRRSSSPAARTSIPRRTSTCTKLTLTFVDDDHIEVKGTGWENGAPAKDMCCGLKLVRKK